MRYIAFLRFLSVRLLPVFILLFGFSIASIFAQTTLTKTFDRTRLPNDAPIVLSDSRLGERRIYKQMDFAQADWLKFLSLKIRNLTNNNIVYLSLGFDFPETKKLGAMMSYSTSRGTFGTRLTRDKQLIVLGSNNPPFQLAPGADADINLAGEYVRLTKFIESRTPIANINQVVLEIRKIVLDDGSQWERSEGWFREDAAGIIMQIPAPDLRPPSWAN